MAFVFWSWSEYEMDVWIGQKFQISEEQGTREQLKKPGS